MIFKNKKRAFSNLMNALIFLLLLALIFAIVWPKFGTIKKSLFGIGEIEKKCEATGKTLDEYKMELSSFFRDPEKFKEEIIQQCDEIKSCFSKEYKSLKDRCESVKTGT